jgi:DtxR family Mn-dependent transcriptional regulator
MTQALSESLEDYLEAIYHIVSQKQAARATDISRRMKVKASSVTGALRSLADKGLINYAPYDIVTLTPEGSAAARRVAHGHEVLRDFFTLVLAVDDDRADRAACGMEHHVGRDVLRRLGYLARFIADGTAADGGQWLDRFREYCSLHEGRAAAGSASRPRRQSATASKSTSSGPGRRKLAARRKTRHE